MSLLIKKMFSQTVMNSRDLPSWAQSHVESARDVQMRVFDQSYIEFLDEQITLSPRGPEWTGILQKRRDVLLAFCDKPLINGVISAGRKHCSIKVDPESKTIVHWEINEYDMGSPDNFD